MHPEYQRFNSEELGANKHRQSDMKANVETLSNFTILHDFIEKDINKSRSSLAILKKRTYKGYLFWHKKNQIKSDPEVRIAPNKLDTRINVEQFVMVHSKYHPYSEELNRFILKIEVN